MVYCSAIYADNTSYHGPYIIIFSNSTYTHQEDSNIDGQFIPSVEILCKEIHYLPITINSRYYVSPKNKSNNTIVSLREIINGNIDVKCYYYYYVVPLSLRAISHNYIRSLAILHFPTEEHDNIMDENNQKDIIKFELSVLIVIKELNYGYNGEIWDSI